MSAFEELLKKNNRGQLVAAVVLAIYIISGVNTTPEIAQYVNNSIGHIVIILVVLCLFSKTNLVLGIVIIIAGYELIRRSHPKNTKAHLHKTHFRSPLLENFQANNSPTAAAPVAPEELAHDSHNKTQKMMNMQPEQEDNLEVDIASRITPLTHATNDIEVSPYSSVQCNTHDAAPV